jgi:hypothetical protein
MRTGVVTIGGGTATLQKLAAPPAGVSVQQTQIGMRAPSAPGAAAPAAATPAAPAPVAAPTGEPSIVLPDGSKIAAGPDLPMLSWLSQAGAASEDSGSIDGKCQTQWECWDQGEPTDSGGSCGKCVVTILEGMACLSEATTKEKNTINRKSKKFFGGKIDDKSRLACQAMVTGPVKIQQNGKAD